MKFFCDQCNAQYMIADEKVGPRGVKVKCKKCSHVIVVKPAGGDATTIDTRAPAAAAAAAAAAPAAAPAPKKSESEISGAFDSLFGGAGGAAAGGDNAWSTNQTVLAKSPMSAAASEKEWYVAIEDSQVGPIDIAEVQQRWDAKEINEDSLAWKAGMPDWIPVADIPQLSYLVTERPHKKAAAGAAAAPGATTGGAVAKATAPVEWKPSAASALSSLVQEEMAASAAPKETSTKPPEGMPDLGLPGGGFGTGDLFGGKVGGNAAPVDPFAGGGGGAAWSVPSARPSSGGSGGMYALIGGVIFVLLVLAGAVIFMLARSSHQPAVVVQAPPVAAPAAPAAAPAAPAAAPAAAPVAAPAVASADKGGGDEEDERPGKHHKAKPAAKHGGGGGGGGGMEAAPPAAAPEPPAAAAKAALSKDDIWGVVKANGARAAPCLKAARGRNEIPPGKYTFTLNWVIKPNGAVTNAQLTGPPNVIGTSLPNCLAGVVGQWHFPASQAGAPIQNFPFGPINIP